MKSKLSIKLTLIDFLSFVYIGTLCMPVLDQRINTYFLVALVGLLNIVFLAYISQKTHARNVKYFIGMLVFTLLDFVEGVMSGNFSLIFIYQILRASLLVFMGIYYLCYAEKESCKNIFISTMIMLWITSITSIVVLNTDGMASRIMATIGDSKDIYAVQMNLRNLGGFSIVYLCVALIPLIIGLIKTQGKLKLFYIPFVICFTAYIYCAEYTTAMIISALLLLISILKGKSGNTLHAYIYVVVILTIIYLLRYQIADGLYNIAGNVANIVSNRITFLADSIYGIKSTGDTQIRVDYYTRAWNTFLRHPILGGILTGDLQLSGHSHVLDTMAKYGILGIGILIGYYKSIKKFFYNTYRKNRMFFYVILSWVACIILAALNPVDNSFLLFVIIPMCLRWTDNSEQKNIDGKEI